MYSQLRDTTFWSSVRATPFIYFTYASFNLIINPNYENITFLIAYIGNFVLNGILKFISKTIYNLLGTDYIFPFGQGSRPIGATNCGTFAFVSNPKAHSFGMPSGHSQLAWFFSTYWIMDILDKYETQHKNTDNTIKAYSRIIILVIIAAIVSYSRVVVENCHTTGQITIGALIGITSGIICNKLKNYIKIKYYSS